MSGPLSEEEFRRIEEILNGEDTSDIYDVVESLQKNGAFKVRGEKHG